MTKLLAKIFIKDYRNYSDIKVRAAYGKLSGIIGIITNIFLSSIKIITGLLIGSVAILADGLNNLSDAGSSIITLIGFKLSTAPADRDHPFGHQRIEYVSGLIISFIIMTISISLFKSSIEKIINPEAFEISWILIVILVASILIKLWQSYFYRINGKLIKSQTLIATSIDSFNDVLATTAVLVSLIITYFTKVDLDGYMGVVVSIFILISGYKLVKETISPLLGEAPSKEYIEQISADILSFEGILGIHDLVIHTYGPAKTFITVHAEVDSDVDVLISHDIIDNIEHYFLKKYHANLVIHMDPIETKCELTLEAKEMIHDILKEIDPVLDFHDFRVVRGKTHDNLIFDVVVPIKYKMPTEELKIEITNRVKQVNKKMNVVITFDEVYIDN